MAFCVRDGNSRRRASVSENNALVVGVQHLPAREQDVAVLTAKQLLQIFFVDAAGSGALNVDGSVTPVVFTLPPQPLTIQFITRIRLIFNDEQMDLSAAAELRRFGSAAAAPGLTNGLLLQVIQELVTTAVFTNPVRSISDFFNYNNSFVNFPNGIAAGEDFLSIDIIFEAPIVLINLDTIQMTVQDNLTAVNLFSVLAFGWQEAL